MVKMATRHEEPETVSPPLEETESLVWNDSATGNLRLVRVNAPDGAPSFRIDGHADAGSFAVSVLFDSDDAEKRARLYLAAYREAGGFPVPKDLPLSVPVQLLALPRRYHAAYLIGATEMNALSVAQRLSGEDEDLSVESIYSYLSRVRNDHAELFEE